MLSLDRILAPGARFWVLLVSFTPYGVISYAIALALLLLGRPRVGPRQRTASTLGIVVAITGLALHLVWLAPAYLGSHAEGEPDLTVLTLNMRYGAADPAAVADLARTARADVIVLEEVTPASLSALADRGVGGPGTDWPYSGGRALPGAEGTAVLSAYPISDQHDLDRQMGVYRMRVDAPRPFTLTAVHTIQPVDDTPGWSADLAALRRDARSVTGPHLQVGDFNATLDHGAMRRLLGAGLHDAAQRANAGWQPTWPAPSSRSGVRFDSPFPLIAIDHVLLSEHFSAISTRTYQVPDTDHLALVTELAER